MSLRRLAPRFVDWRLSRIDEEVDRVSCCSSDVTSPPSPPLPPPPPLLLDDDPAASDSSAADEGPAPPAPLDVIYSNADEWRKQQLERSAADDEREALRFIKEKYDSLGKNVVEKPNSTSQGSAAPRQNGLEQTASVYENVPRGCSKTKMTAESRDESVQRTECAAECRSAEVASNPALCCSAKHSGAVQNRELKPSQHQRPACQCQHQRQQQETDRQRQVVAGECIPRSLLSDGELMQIDLFYRSYKSSVYVSTCMATLSFSRPVLTVSAKSKSTPRPPDEHDDGVWSCVRTGIPVIVRDNGDGRRRRRVYVLLAERGTGFELWRAPLDRLSDYTVAAAASVSAGVSCSQHTMRLSVDNTVSVTARLAFDNDKGADEFHRQLLRLATAADDDDATTATAARGSQAKKKRCRKNTRSISKADISQPCCFSHVTRLERGVSCRGRPGLHIVVASGRHSSPAEGMAAAPADSTPPPPSTSLRTAVRHCHSSFKADYVI